MEWMRGSKKVIDGQLCNSSLKLDIIKSSTNCY
jgi:hypothetical protein